MKRSNLVLCAVIMLGLVALWVAAGHFSQASAQGNGDIWTSSADAPAGTPLERYSPPDRPAADVLTEEPESPEALISWRVTGSALKPRENDVSYATNTTGACTYVTAGDEFTVWNIPVQVPQGSVVDTVRMYFDDTSGSNTTGWFTIYDLYGEIVDEWAVSSSGDSGLSFADTDPIDHTVDYSTYSYMVNWRPVVTGSTLQLCGFRVFHDTPFFGTGFLPFFQSDSP